MDDWDAILIAGPTASGKSAMAMRFAQELGGVVVNADSMQVYSELRIVTARPSPADERMVAHALYGHVPAAEHYSTGRWYRDVEALLPRLNAEGKIPVFVGGTGLYFKALLGGLSEMPNVPDDVRQRWRYRLAEEGAGKLHRLLRAKDPETAMVLKPGDGQRIVRALEILETTGKSIRSFQTASGRSLLDPDRVRAIALLPERAELNARIEQRFEAMIENGAVEEVKAFLALRLSLSQPAMKAIGVREIGAYLAGEVTLEQAKAQAIQASRQYSKRQMTWFRNQLDENWERNTT